MGLVDAFGSMAVLGASRNPVNRVVVPAVPAAGQRLSVCYPCAACSRASAPISLRHVRFGPRRVPDRVTLSVEEHPPRWIAGSSVCGKMILLRE